MAENKQQNKNIFKKFRSTTGDLFEGALRWNITKRFDEPTYFSFKLVFASNNDINYNIASDQALYDTMPHPLFNKVNTGDIEMVAERFKMPRAGEPGSFTTSAPTYSSVSFLHNSNEPTRTKMLIEFIDKFNTIQNQYPYYFQSIEGLSDLLKIDPTKGQRVTNDKKITITCLEGVDLRMSYLLNLYRKIVWDDVYQRWVLPDMMRYFTLDIYLAEFRTFHIPGVRYQGEETQSITEIGKNPLYLDVLNDVLPVWKITCEMCEFDITDMDFGQLHGLDVGSDHEQVKIKFGIKIGNVKETQMYPMFEHMYLIDRKLNGINRAIDASSVSTSAQDNNNLYAPSLRIAQGRAYGDDYHISGLPFNEGANSTKMYGQGGPGSDSEWGNADDDIVEVNPTNPNTWIGNAAKTGTAFAKNLAKTYINKGKIMNIPGLGVSFTEVQSAIQAKNVVGALGLIRKGVNETVKQFGNAPSERLQQPIQTDKIMLAFLTELEKLSKSRATDDETQFLGQAANLALNDKNIWDQIKDFSLATDLVGPNEVNIKKSIIEANQFRKNVEDQSKSSIIGAIPIILPNAVNGNIENELVTNNTIPSEQLSNNIGDSIILPKTSERLSNNINNELKINGKTDQIKTKSITIDSIIEYAPSSLLSQQVQGGAINQPTPSKATNNNLEK